MVSESAYQEPLSSLELTFVRRGVCGKVGHRLRAPKLQTTNVRRTD